VPEKPAHSYQTSSWDRCGKHSKGGGSGSLEEEQGESKRNFSLYSMVSTGPAGGEKSRKTKFCEVPAGAGRQKSRLGERLRKVSKLKRKETRRTDSAPGKAVFCVVMSGTTEEHEKEEWTATARRVGYEGGKGSPISAAQPQQKKRLEGALALTRKEASSQGYVPRAEKRA